MLSALLAAVTKLFCLTLRKDSIMNKTKMLLAVLATAGMGWGTPAMADPVIGFDPCGGSGAVVGLDCGFHFASVFTNRTDSGVDVGPITAGSFHTFSSQMVVTALTNNGVDTTPLGINKIVPATQIALNALGIPTFELSKTIALTDFLLTVTVDPILGTTTLLFVHPFDQPASLNIYFDTLSPTDKSQAVQTGPSGAKCYGAGTSGAAFGCALDGGPPILTATLIGNTSGFIATGIGSGNGSFDLTYEITSFNPAYLNLDNLAVNGGTGNHIFSERFTGTLTQPFSGFSPAPVQMWDGTTVAGTDHNLFKVDSSQSFVAGVPEPGSLFLLGLGLAGLGAISRRRSA